jgi:hypothetical protein
MTVSQKPEAIDRWYYASGKQKIGPFSFEQLRQLTIAGLVPPDTMVWREGSHKWMPLSSVRSFTSIANKVIGDTVASSLAATPPSILSPSVSSKATANDCLRLPCPYCNSPVEIVTPESGQHRNCPNCHEVFRLPVDSFEETYGLPKAIASRDISKPLLWGLFGGGALGLLLAIFVVGSGGNSEILFQLPFAFAFGGMIFVPIIAAGAGSIFLKKVILDKVIPGVADGAGEALGKLIEGGESLIVSRRIRKISAQALLARKDATPPRYLLFSGGQLYGPFQEAECRAFNDNQQASPNTLVYQEGNEKWLDLRMYCTTMRVVDAKAAPSTGSSDDGLEQRLNHLWSFFLKMLVIGGVIAAVTCLLAAVFHL